MLLLRPGRWNGWNKSVTCSKVSYAIFKRMTEARRKGAAAASQKKYYHERKYAKQHLASNKKCVLTKHKAEIIIQKFPLKTQDKPLTHTLDISRVNNCSGALLILSIRQLILKGSRPQME